MNKVFEIIKKNTDDIIKPVVVLLAICIVIPLALSLTNAITVDRIADLQKQNEEKAMAMLIKADKFEKTTFEGKNESFDFHIAKSAEGEALGYIFITASKGYGGEVSVMTAVGTDGKIKEISILDASNETPGLGQNVTKESFYSQFKEKTADIKVEKGNVGSTENKVSAVTGATISSKAVTSAVNKAMEYFSEYSNQASIDTEVAAVEE